MFCGKKTVTGKQVAAVCISYSEWIAVDPISGFEMSLEIGCPCVIGFRDGTERFPGMKTLPAPAPSLDASVFIENQAGCGNCRQFPIGMIFTNSPEQFLSSPGRMPVAQSNDFVFDFQRCASWKMMW